MFGMSLSKKLLKPTSTQQKNNQKFSEVKRGLIVYTIVLLLAGFCYLAGLSLIIPIILLFSGIYLSYFKKGNYKLLLNLGLLLAIIVFTAQAMLYYGHFSPIYIPVATIAMLVILLYKDIQLAFLLAFLSSLLTAMVVGNNFELMLIFFIGSMTGVYTIKDARTREDLIKGGLFVGIMQALCAVLLNPDFTLFLKKEFIFGHLGGLLLNGIIAAGVVLLTSRIFEWLFGVLTNFSLLELSDFNQPLLKRMVLEAPGTYHHSLVVSNLAEAAADAIGADALLTRVGAYYHDIGKLVKPEYFTENQLVSGNRHENLEPTMSRLVILNHVREGIELAKKYRLNQNIIDFIQQHHGTSLIHYFYQKALETADDKESVDENNFRYPGPRPQSRETAIVLLADSTEGAVRAQEENNPNRIDEVVRKIINNKFIDGQLDESGLTLKELEVIRATFTRVLSAMYHSRIKYPDQSDEKGNSNKKSSEKSSAKSKTDSDNHRQIFEA